MKKFIDIGANLTDNVFKGIYRGKEVHTNDFNHIMTRALSVGLEKIIVTAGCENDIIDALDVVNSHDNLYCTVGVHPTRCNEFKDASSPEEHLNKLRKFIAENKEKVVAIGELGLDYDRTQFCAIETQKMYFDLQLQLAVETKLPLFLHSRNCANDFIKILETHKDLISGGVVHSFTGSCEEAKAYIDMGLFIGINGCSLKTEENLEAMASIPKERLMIETDAPWCGIKPTHAGFKYIKTKWDVKKKEKWTESCTIKDRVEPCHIVQVLEVMSGYRGEDPNMLCEQMYENSFKMFFSS